MSHWCQRGRDATAKLGNAGKTAAKCGKSQLTNPARSIKNEDEESWRGIARTASDCSNGCLCVISICDGAMQGVRRHLSELESVPARNSDHCFALVRYDDESSIGIREYELFWRDVGSQ